MGTGPQQRSAPHTESINRPPRPKTKWGQCAPSPTTSAWHQRQWHQMAVAGRRPPLTPLFRLSGCPVSPRGSTKRLVPGRPAAFSLRGCIRRSRSDGMVRHAAWAPARATHSPFENGGSAKQRGPCPVIRGMPLVIAPRKAAGRLPRSRGPSPSLPELCRGVCGGLKSRRMRAAQAITGNRSMRWFARDEHFSTRPQAAGRAGGMMTGHAPFARYCMICSSRLQTHA